MHCTGRLSVMVCLSQLRSLIAPLLPRDVHQDWHNVNKTLHKGKETERKGRDRKEGKKKTLCNISP